MEISKLKNIAFSHQNFETVRREAIELAEQNIILADENEKLKKEGREFKEALKARLKEIEGKGFWQKVFGFAGIISSLWELLKEE